MSQENIEVVRALFDAWNARDWDAFAAQHDPDVIWARFEGWPEAGTLVGREACINQYELSREPFDDDRVEAITDFIAAGDRVVVRASWRAKGRGPDFNLELTRVFTVRKRKIFIIEDFWDHADALEALGLSEQDAHTDS
jgi:ketosteroid isomerase-like protein